MFIKFVDIDYFLCNSYPCVLFESLSHVINQESHVYSWNLGKIYFVHFLRFWNLLRFIREILQFQKSELGRFIPNFLLKVDIQMFLEWENNNRKLQIISGKFQNNGTFQNNAINDVKQFSLSHVIIKLMVSVINDVSMWHRPCY